MRNELYSDSFHVVLAWNSRPTKCQCCIATVTVVVYRYLELWSFFVVNFFSNRFHPQQLNTKVCKLIENSVCFFPYAYVTKTTLNQRNGSNFCHFKAAKVREQITRKSNLYPFFLSQHYISTNRKDNMKYDFCKHALFYYALSAIFWSLLKTND